MYQPLAGFGGFGGGVIIEDGASNNLIGTSGHSADDAGQRNIISGSLEDGIDIYDANGTVVAGDYIGTNPAGTVAIPNANNVDIYLVDVSSGWVGLNPVYGSQDADQDNVISASGYAGVAILQCTGLVVAGNLIGTDVSGTIALGNDGVGVEIAHDSSNNTIGGSTPGAGNLISGNTGDGVLIGGGASANVVVGNYIGTNLTGTAAVRNTGDGVQINGGATNNTIGSTAAGSGNVISGNSSSGVYVDSTSAGTVIAGDLIGTNASGGNPFGNGSSGVVNYDLETTISDCTISGDTSSRGINNYGTLTVTDCTISNNTFHSGGAGINDAGTLIITGSTLSGNSGRFGGAIWVQGTMVADDCTFVANRVSTGGGAVYNSRTDLGQGRMSLLDCNFTGNSAGTTGGAIAASATGSISGCTFRGNVSNALGGGGICVSVGVLTITNSTLVDNTATDQGGGILVHVEGTLKAENDTIADNIAVTGGGVAIEPGLTVTIGNTIVADNTGTSSDPDVFGTFASQGHNLIGKTDGSTGWVSSDLTGTVAQPLDPMLAPLASNGGPTETIALLPGSPAIDGGSIALAINPASGRPLATDQRGVGYLRVVSGTVDIGALETANPDSGNPTVLIVTNTSDSASVPGSLAMSS